MSQSQIIKSIKEFNNIRLENWDKAIEISETFLSLLAECSVTELFPRSCIRYLFANGWPLNINVPNKELWNKVLDRFYSKEVAKLVSENYISETREMIKELFDFDIPDPVISIVVKAPAKKATKKAKITKAQPVDEDGESGSKSFKSLSE